MKDVTITKLPDNEPTTPEQIIDDMKVAREIITAPGNPPPPQNVVMSEEMRQRYATKFETKVSSKLTVAPVIKTINHSYLKVMWFGAGHINNGTAATVDEPPNPIMRRFNFQRVPKLMAHVRYHLALWEDGRCYVSQAVWFPQDTDLQWVNVLISRPGLKGCRAWLSLETTPVTYMMKQEYTTGTTLLGKSR